MAPATKKELENKMQQVGSELQKIELELQKCVEVRQRLDSQMNENDQVKKVRQRRSTQGSGLPASWLVVDDQEFAVLKPDNVVYKMVGPVLLKQDQQEAKTNVDKRLEFIKSEM
jgi:prefoldin beta subunit